MKSPLLNPILMTTIQKERLLTNTQKQLDECLAMLALLVYKNGNELSFNAEELMTMPDLLFSVEQEENKVILKLIEKPVEESAEEVIEN